MRNGGDNQLLIARLTAREKDCLHHLRAGLSTSEVARLLGISNSTLAKHLASARGKLGVARTSQALLAFAQADWHGPSNGYTTDRPPDLIGSYTKIAEQSHLLSSFATQLEHCASLAAAWDHFERNFQALGLSKACYGVIAEPLGQLRNGVRFLMSSYPREIQDILDESRDPRSDPISQHFSQSTALWRMDHETLYSIARSSVSQDMRTIMEVMLDHQYRMHLCVPCRDSSTGGSFGATYLVNGDLIVGNGGIMQELERTLRSLQALFWQSCLQKGFVAGLSGLTGKQRELLGFIARGFSTDEIADQQAVSKRAVEKMLANARRALGVPTTAAAIYSAMVYRAIP